MITKNNKFNQFSDLEQIKSKINKLTTRLWAGTFILLFIILAGGFFIFSGMNFKMVAEAFINNYDSKQSGSILTADEWKNLDNDFTPIPPAWNNISGIPAGFSDGVDNIGGTRGACAWRNAGTSHSNTVECQSNEYISGLKTNNQWTTSEWNKHQYIVEVYCCKIQ